MRLKGPPYRDKPITVREESDRGVQVLSHSGGPPLVYRSAPPEVPAKLPASPRRLDPGEHFQPLGPYCYLPRYLRTELIHDLSHEPWGPARHDLLKPPSMSSHRHNPFTHPRADTNPSPTRRADSTIVVPPEYFDPHNRFAPGFEPSPVVRPILPRTTLLPRSSSFFPPPQALQSPTPKPSTAFAIPEESGHETESLRASSTSPRLPPSTHRPSQPHSRSSSFGGVFDGLRSLNRWSTSTSASSVLRRGSIDTASLAHSDWYSTPNGPHKPQKPRRPSAPAASISPDIEPLHITSYDATNSTGHARSQSLHLLNDLPPVLTLPSLEQEFSAQVVLAGHAQALPGIPLSKRPLAEATHASDDRGVSSEEVQNTANSAGQLPTQGRPGSSASMLAERSVSAVPATAHSKSKSQSSRGSVDRSSQSRSARDRPGKQPSQKAMLSRALQRANTAVQLDNAQNFEGARQSYEEACGLLQQVLQRTTGDEDKRKLEAIVSKQTSHPLRVRAPCPCRIVKLLVLKMLLFFIADSAVADFAPFFPCSCSEQPTRIASMS